LIRIDRIVTNKRITGNEKSSKKPLSANEKTPEARDDKIAIKIK
jgi:hypothetical protein